MEDGSGSRIDPIHLPYGVDPDKGIFSLLKKSGVFRWLVSMSK